MQVAVYTFALNNSADILQWMADTVEADYRLVFDLGSTDGTDQRLEQNGCTVYRGQDRSMRSDDALNAALALMPAQIEVCFRVGMTERPSPGWRSALEDTDATNTALQVIVDQDGHRYFAPRIHPRLGFRWSGPCRELLMRRDGSALATIDCGIVLTIQETPVDIAVLKAAASESGNPHSVYRYGEALLRHGYLDDGLAEIARLRSIGGPSAQIAHLWRLAAAIDDISCHGYLIEAQGAHSSASNYLAFAEYHFRNQEWAQAYNCCQYALSLLRSAPTRMLLYTDDPRLRGPRLHDVAASAAWNIWDFEAAYGHAVEALRRAPADPIMRRQMQLLKEAIEQGVTLDPEMVVTPVAPSRPNLSVHVIHHEETTIVEAMA